MMCRPRGVDRKTLFCVLYFSVTVCQSRAIRLIQASRAADIVSGVVTWRQGNNCPRF